MHAGASSSLHCCHTQHARMHLGVRAGSPGACLLSEPNTEGSAAAASLGSSVWLHTRAARSMAAWRLLRAA